MATKVTLPQNDYFVDQIKLDLLNVVLTDRDALSPGLIRRETGCPYILALTILMKLFELNLANAFLLVYSKENADEMLMRRPFKNGFPKFPFAYILDGISHVVRAKEDVFYTFEFDLISDVEFEAEDMNSVPTER